MRDKAQAAAQAEAQAQAQAAAQAQAQQAQSQPAGLMTVDIDAIGAAVKQQQAAQQAAVNQGAGAGDEQPISRKQMFEMV